MTPGIVVGPRVLVTGGAGFIGSAVSHLLAESTSRWVVLDNLHPQVHGGRSSVSSLHPAAELVVGDVTSSETWTELLRDFRPEVVLHLAAETGTGQSLTESTRHAHTNVTGTAAMLDAFSRAAHIPSRFVLASSRAVYGEGEWEQADGTVFSPRQRSHGQLVAGDWGFGDARPLPSIAGTTRETPSSVYGATKLAQEHLINAWASAHGSSVSVLRLQNVYGPGQSLLNSYTGIVVLFSRMAREGRQIPLYEDGLVTRDFVFIDDVAAAIAAAVKGAGTRVPLDIGSGTSTSLAELARIIAAYHAAPEPTITGLFRDGDVRSATCSIENAREVLGWRPSVALVEGVARLQRWMAHHPR